MRSDIWRGEPLPDGRGSDGVTLMEMMVVVAIVGLIIGVSMPSVAAGIDSVRLASATTSVAGFLNAAVTRVERRQIAIELVISPSAGKILALSNEPGYRGELDMPDGVSIEAVLPKIEEDATVDRRLMLLPGGTAPGIGIQLVNRHGTRRLVHLDPMTGFPRVENLESRQ